MKNEYLNKFIQLNERHLTPKEVIRDWNSFSEDIKSGYNWIPPELSNDLDIEREPIQQLIENKNLSIFKEHKDFIKAIVDIDEYIKDRCYVNKRRETKYWWHDIILKKAGPIYCEFAWNEYRNFKIEKIG